MNLKERIRAAGRDLGFTRVGFAAPAERPESVLLREWVSLGYAGEMDWIARRIPERSDARALLPWARTLILATISYGGEDGPHHPLRGAISRYARGRDYHRVVRKRLEALAAVLKRESPGARARPIVDTGAVLEKPWAVAAGLGWQGKHTNLIDPETGSWLLIGEIATDVEMDPDAGAVTDRCGTCTRCLDACPTSAFAAPYLLDSRRCISYLTIEHRGSIPEALRPAMGEWIFGCDVCQEVCPWNRDPAPADPDLAGARVVPDLAGLMGLTQEEFRVRFADSPVRRTGWRRFLRNVAVALGNSGDPRAKAPLEAALRHPDPMVREHVQWALDRIRGGEGA